MNYSAMIQNRKSVRAFRGKEVPNEALAQLRTYYEKTCPRLVPEIATEGTPSPSAGTPSPLWARLWCIGRRPW